MKFIFDTGASNVCISSAVANMMLDNGYLDKSDIVGTGATQIANGEIVEHTIIYIKEIEIAGLKLENIEASVIHQQEAPLLMGQSAIQKLGPVEINVDRIMSTLGEAKAAYDIGDYEKAEEKFAMVYQTGTMPDFFKYMYANMCWENKKYEKADRIISEIKDLKDFEESGIDIYQLIGHIKAEVGKYDLAIRYYQLSYDKMSSTYDERSKNKQWMAYCYEDKGDFKNAAEYYFQAMGEYAKQNNVTESYMMSDAFGELKRGQKSYRDDHIDYLFFRMYYCSVHAGMLSNSEGWYFMEQLAKANNRHAQKYQNSQRR